MESLLKQAESKFSDRHMVAAGHHMAAEAAREILDGGGNAADAGVCGGICLAVLLHIHLHQMPVQDAISAPRFATMSFPQTSTPHEYHKDLLLLEDRFPDDICNWLSHAGHCVKKWRDFDWRAGEVCAIKRDEKTGRLEGGADPRRPSGVA